MFAAAASGGGGGAVEVADVVFDGQMTMVGHAESMCTYKRMRT